MKKIKSMFFALVMVLSMVFLVAGCGKKTTTQATTTEPTEVAPIKVQTIKGGDASSTSLNSTLRMAKLNTKIEKLYDEPTTTTTDSNYNYFVIVKSKHQISITVTVSNPKAVQIDMVEVASSDENAKIKTYTNQQETWQVIKDQNVVGWNGSNVYTSRWDVETTEDADEVTFTVTGFKVNGEWQKSELGNNVLHVYKYEDTDIRLDVITNGFNGQVNNSVETFKVLNNNENIIIKSVYVDYDLDIPESKLTADENGVYSITNKNDVYTRNIYVKYTFKLGDTGLESEILTSNKLELNLARISGEYLLTMNFDELLLSINMSGDNINPNYTYYLNGTEITSTGTHEEDGLTYLVFKNSEWVVRDDARNAIQNISVKINNVTYNLSRTDGQLALTFTIA